MRLTLTKKEVESEVGEKLRDYLWWIAEDGYVSDEEIKHMQGWLNASEGVSHIAAFHYLKELVNGVLLDGVIDEPERVEIHRAILRVLPKDYREHANSRKNLLEKDRKASVAIEEGRKAIQKTKQNLATDRQIAYLKDLGGDLSQNMTKVEASKQITKLTQRTATVRQQMVLKFWGRSDLSTNSVDEVSDWMDAWYDADPRRIEAWELWKDEVGDYGIRDFSYIERVPEGGGNIYLKKVETLHKGGKISKGNGQANVNNVVVGVVLVILLLVFKSCLG